MYISFLFTWCFLLWVSILPSLSGWSTVYLGKACLAIWFCSPLVFVWVITDCVVILSWLRLIYLVLWSGAWHGSYGFSVKIMISRLWHSVSRMFILTRKCKKKNIKKGNKVQIKIKKVNKSKRELCTFSSYYIMWFVIRVAKGWNISGKFPETFEKSQKDSKKSWKVSKISDNFRNVLENVHIFATLFVN